MKAFVVFVPQVAGSREHALTVLESIQRHRGWEAELLPGTTPDTLPLYQQWFPLQDQSPSRIEGFREHAHDTYLTKMSCFYNHVRVWHRAIELDQPVAFIEHDAVCVRNWDDKEFSQVLILNPISSTKVSFIKKHLIKNGHSDFLKIDSKHVATWQLPLYYRHGGNIPLPIMIPGTAAYAITPTTAKNLLTRAVSSGWEQSDHFINSHNCELEYCTPDYFDLRLENLRLSHGLPQTERG